MNTFEPKGTSTPTTRASVETAPSCDVCRPKLRASLYTNLQPFLAAIFALLVLSERLGAFEIAGGFVIAGGLLLGRRRPLPAPLGE